MDGKIYQYHIKDKDADHFKYNLKLINKIKMLLVIVSAGFVFFKLNINNKQHIRIAVNYDK